MCHLLKKYQQTRELISTRKTSHEQSPESPTASLKDVTQIPDLSQQRPESPTPSLKDVTQIPDLSQQRPEVPTVSLKDVTQTPDLSQQRPDSPIVNSPRCFSVNNELTMMFLCTQ